MNALPEAVHRFLYQDIESVERLEVPVLLLKHPSAILRAIIDKSRGGGRPA